MKKFIFLFLAVFLTGKTVAQEFSIKRFELAGDKLIIFYDLIDTTRNRFYTINAYASSDNYLNPLQKLSGDAGLEVRPGVNKKLIWNAKEELGAEFAGKVGLEIRGRVYVPFVRFAHFEDAKSRKRGVPFTLTWSGGTRQNVLNFDLYKGDAKVWTKAGIGNTGNSELIIPSNIRPGKGYRFKVSDSKNKDEVVYTGYFAIKRKIPLLLKALPVAVVGVVASLVINPPPPPKTIPNAPCPDDTNCN